MILWAWHCYLVQWHGTNLDLQLGTNFQVKKLFWFSDGFANAIMLSVLFIAVYSYHQLTLEQTLLLLNPLPPGRHGCKLRLIIFKLITVFSISCNIALGAMPHLWWLVNIDLADGWVPSGNRPSIIWANVDPDLCLVNMILKHSDKKDVYAYVYMI